VNNCSKYGNQAQLYFDHELSGQELELFQWHLPMCYVCQEYLRQMHKLSGLLRGSRPLFSAPRDLYARLIKASKEK
jgi:hypothetical protein